MPVRLPSQLPHASSQKHQLFTYNAATTQLVAPQRGRAEIELSPYIGPYIDPCPPTQQRLSGLFRTLAEEAVRLPSGGTGGFAAMKTRVGENATHGIRGSLGKD